MFFFRFHLSFGLHSLDLSVGSQLSTCRFCFPLCTNCALLLPEGFA